jgi:hypothetical protein
MQCVREKRGPSFGRHPHHPTAKKREGEAYLPRRDKKYMAYPREDMPRVVLAMKVVFKGTGMMGRKLTRTRGITIKEDKSECISNASTELL